MKADLAQEIADTSQPEEIEAEMQYITKQLSRKTYVAIIYNREIGIL